MKTLKRNYHMKLNEQQFMSVLAQHVGHVRRLHGPYEANICYDLKISNGRVESCDIMLGPPKTGEEAAR